MGRNARGAGPAAGAAALLAFFVTVAVFWPVTRHHFLSWDDPTVLLGNPRLRGLSPENLRWMLSSSYSGFRQVLYWLSFGADYALWGGFDPVGFHLSTLILHGLNAALVAWIAALLLGAAEPEAPAYCGTPPPWTGIGVPVLAALAFSLHPLRAECVAWPVGRADSLAAFFAALCAACHLESALADRASPDQASPGRTSTGRGRLWLAAALASYGLSLMSKPSAALLPAVILVLEIHPLKRLPGPEGSRFGGPAGTAWRGLLAYLAVGAAGGAVAFLGVEPSQSVLPVESYGLPQRLAQAGWAHWFYLWKTAAPAGLAPMYERLVRFDPFEARFVLSAAALAAAGPAAWLLRRRLPAVSAAWACYLAFLSPVSGLLKPLRAQFVADRYSYLPGMVFGILFAAGAGRLAGALAPERRRWVLAAAFALVGLTGLAGRRQAMYWRDSEALYRRALAVDPSQSVAHNNLGIVLERQGRWQEALQEFEAALAARPRYVHAHNNLGGLLLKLGRIDEARRHLEAVLSIDPNHADARHNLELMRSFNLLKAGGGKGGLARGPGAGGSTPPRPAPRPHRLY